MRSFEVSSSEHIQTRPSPHRADLDVAVPEIEISQATPRLLRLREGILSFWIAMAIGIAGAFYFRQPLLPAAAIILWVFVYALWRSGIFTWLRVARQPAKLYARGQGDQAEASFEQALRYAESKYRDDDHRRASILIVLADYSAQTARAERAASLYQEALRILCRIIERRPFEYFLCLNNHAVLLINWKNYAKAQSLLELASEIIKPYRKFQHAPIGLVTQLLRFNLISVYIFEKQYEAAERLIGEMDPTAVSALARQRKLVREMTASAQARLWCARRQYERALQACATITRMPHFATLPRCQALLGLERWQEAETVVGAILNSLNNLAPTHPVRLDYYVFMVDCLLGRGEWQQAQLWRTQALQAATAHGLLTHRFWTEAQARWRSVLERAGQQDLAAVWDLMPTAVMQESPFAETAIRELNAES